MKKHTKLLIVSLAVCFMTIISSFSANAQVKDWFLTGSDPDNYTIGLEKSEDRNGNVAFIKCKKEKIKKGFGTIMQSFDAEIYSGKTVRLSGYIKTDNVIEWSGMWMRVDSKNKHAVSFDNMQDRPITGSTDWKKYEIILEVPKNSTRVSYGVLLVGSGSVFLDDLNFEVIKTDETITGIQRLDNPTNGDFEE